MATMYCCKTLIRRKESLPDIRSVKEQNKSVRLGLIIYDNLDMIAIFSRTVLIFGNFRIFHFGERSEEGKS
jgi:hypothetical protein